MGDGPVGCQRQVIAGDLVVVRNWTDVRSCVLQGPRELGGLWRLGISGITLGWPKMDTGTKMALDWQSQGPVS